MIFFISLWTKTALISFVPQNTCVHSEAQCTCAEIKLISLGDCPYLGNVKSNQCIYSWLEMDPEKLLFMFHIHSYLLSRTVMFKEMQPSSFAFAFAQKVLARLLKLIKDVILQISGDRQRWWWFILIQKDQATTCEKHKTLDNGNQTDSCWGKQEEPFHDYGCQHKPLRLLMVMNMSERIMKTEAKACKITSVT